MIQIKGYNYLKLILYILLNINYFKNRVKRENTNIESTFNLFINTLIVIDKTIYDFFKDNYPTLESDSLTFGSALSAIASIKKFADVINNMTL